MSRAALRGAVLWGALMLMGLPSLPLARAATAPLLVDNFESTRTKNKLGNRADIFMKEPSKVLMTFATDEIEKRSTRVLKIKYDQINGTADGQPGGWCGYYSLMKSAGALVAPTEKDPDPQPQAEQYFNALPYKVLTFWVKGETGKENFVIGLSDRHWDRIGDSVKSQEIGRYLPEGHLSNQWQKATLPLEEFFVDMGELAAIAVVFEGDLYPETGGSGTVYIDDITLE